MKVNWASGLDEGGRPIQTPQPAGMPTCPGQPGRHQLVLAVVQPAHRALLLLGVGKLRDRSIGKEQCEYAAGPQFHRRRRRDGDAGAGRAERSASAAAVPINNWTNDVGNGAVIAIDPQTGKAKWKFEHVRRHRRRHPDDGVGTCCSPADAKAISTRSTHAPGACCGRRISAAPIVSAPVTYSIDGKQYVIVISGNVMATFALRE